MIRDKGLGAAGIGRRAEASAATQLAVEIEWLDGKLPGSYLRPPPELSPSERDIANRVEEILRHRDLARFLSILEQHNREPKIVPGRRLPVPSSFLLAPHLFQVLESHQAREERRRKSPVFDLPAADVRTHLRGVSGRCKALADLARKGPQPHVALAAQTEANEVLKIFMPTTELFEGSDDSERQVVAFTTLLERAAGWYDTLAEQAQRAKQNKHTGKGALRVRAAEFLPRVFHKRLGHHYHDHVATIATAISGIPTTADFVKKVDARRKRAERQR